MSRSKIKAVIAEEPTSTLIVLLFSDHPGVEQWLAVMVPERTHDDCEIASEEAALEIDRRIPIPKALS